MRTSDTGGWLFRHRTWLPLPIVATLLFIPSQSLPSFLVWIGVLIVIAGEWLRLWAVRHIGAVSRTRSERLGPLVTTGPFGYTRNPLYIGNFALWVGFTISAGLVWLLPIVVLVVAFEYHAIVRWEEQLLEARIGDPYRAYVLSVPRWMPGSRATEAAAPTQPNARFSWPETLFSERGTLIAIVAGYSLLWLKAWLLT